jgi:DHA3 family multidrug efflux protein-like MFS transporter
VFGLAQAVESASSPLTAFIIAPVAQFIIIPYMQTDAGKQAFGWLLGAGEARGIALVFLVASLIMLIVAIFAFRTRAYRRLSDSYQKA